MEYEPNVCSPLLFKTFLAQKYGYRPFPPKISASEFNQLLSAVNKDDNVALLKKWFWLDESLVPPTYILQPITDLLPHYNNQNVTKEERSEASNQWWTDFEAIQVILREAAAIALKDNQSAKWKYFMSGMTRVSELFQTSEMERFAKILYVFSC